MKFKFNNNSSIFVLLLFFTGPLVKAQVEYSAELELRLLESTQEKLPFWMYSNQRGRIQERTNYLGRLSGEASYDLGEQSLLVLGLGGLVHDEFEEELALDKAYIEYVHPIFYITAGFKQREELYNGLSATNENILWSLNARPLPGFEVGTTKPFALFPGVGFEATWGEYVLEEDRHVRSARVHHKSLHLVVQPSEEWLIRVGMLHFAQWGGVSSTRGQQPTGFMDYLRIFSGRAGGEDAVAGDQANSLGNHLGSWTIEIKKEFEGSALTFIYNNLFEDGSGSRLDNIPDGRYGLFFEKAEQIQLLNSFMYELYYTREQSATGPHLYDNYFNNFLTYESGWTFHEKVLGVPFFTYDKGKDRIINNKFLAHHVGIAGNFGSSYNSLPYKLLLSYRHNEGTYIYDEIPADMEPHIFSTYFTTRVFNGFYQDKKPLLFMDVVLAADFNNLSDPNFGAGISLSYKIF